MGPEVLEQPVVSKRVLEGTGLADQVGRFHDGNSRNILPGQQIAFNDREYRHSGHFIHGAWMDIRDAEGNRLWDRRFQSMHPFQLIDWLEDGTLQVAVCSDLQRHAPQPNLQIFDGHGSLVDVVPTVSDPRGAPERSIPGRLLQHPYAPFPHGHILVFERGRIRR